MQGSALPTINRQLPRAFPRGDYVIVSLELRLPGEDSPLSPGFSATVSGWEKRSNASALACSRMGRDIDYGGADHETILRAFPELAPFVALHLSDPDGTPMHALANAWYFYSGGHEEYERKNYGQEYIDRHGTGLERACRTLRVDSIPEGLNEDEFRAFVDAQRERWAREAAEARALLESLPTLYELRGYDAYGERVPQRHYPNVTI
jgi:hypothetical protein